MKKDYQDSNLFDSNNIDKIDTNTIKTTNVNVLLNRVRLDKKRTLKKKNFILNNNCNLSEYNSNFFSNLIKFKDYFYKYK